MPPEPDSVREALLELIPGVGTPFLVLPTAHDVAAKSGADLSDVQIVMSSLDTCLEFLLMPLASDAERTLSNITISRNPSLSEQAAILRQGIRVAMRHPSEIRLLLLLLDRNAPAVANHLADTILYSTGLRIIGIDHEPEPALQRRVALVWELVCIAVISHRHGLEHDGADDETLEALVTACLGILHPPTD
jgi:hypothetical protein